MKIIKPATLTIGWTVSSVRPPELSATFIVKGTYSLEPGQMAIPVEKPELPSGDVTYPDGEETSLYYGSDFAPMKLRTDLQLIATCHGENGGSIRGARATFGVGSWRKTLAVIGNRSWKGVPGARSMSDPEPFTRLPIRYENAYGGPGYPSNPLGKGYENRALPNVENLQKLIGDSGDHPEPVGFGPLPGIWPQRTGKLATYDRKWEKERWPWFPEDFDWSHFNCAPRDQQLDGFLAGDEPLLFENLDPAWPRFESRLPGVRPQLFYVLRGNDQEMTSEVRLNLDTLWVDLDARRLVLVWRGLGRIVSLKMREVAEVHLVERPMAQPPITWIEHLKNLADAKAAEVEAEEAKKRQDAEAQKQFDAEFAAMDERMAAAEAELEAADEAAEAAIEARLKELGITPAMLEPPPPEYVMATQAAMFDFLKDDPGLLAAGVKIPPPDEATEDAETEPEEVEWTRELVEAAAASGASFVEQDLSGLDLSGLALAGLDFTRATLKGANLTGCSLAGARFTEARMAGAILAGADLKGTTLEKTDLSKAQLGRADLTGAILTSAVFNDANLAEARLANCQADESHFNGADLTKSDCRGANLRYSRMTKSVLDGANFSEANMMQATLEGSSAIQTCFRQVKGKGLRCSGEAVFSRADFREAELPESCWEGANLSGAAFHSAQLVRASFPFAVLVGASLDGADAREARFDDADLTGATLTRANFFKGSFERANLKSADLSHSNAYEVEFWHATIDDALFRGTNLKMTKLAGNHR